MLRFICYANFVLYVLLPLRKDERRGLRVVFRTLLNIYLNQRGGDILIYVRSDIPSKLLTKHVQMTSKDCLLKKVLEKTNG